MLLRNLKIKNGIIFIFYLQLPLCVELCRNATNILLLQQCGMHTFTVFIFLHVNACTSAVYIHASGYFSLYRRNTYP